MLRAVMAAVVVAGLACACTSDRKPSVVEPAVPTAPASEQRPNIVFVLTDDLSTDLLRYMPNVQALMRRGMSFTNYTVADSLCCPSRASIFTGKFPHTTGIFTNSGPYGGFPEFQRRKEDTTTFAPVLAAAGTAPR